MAQLNYQHLYYFYVIAKEGSVTRACAVLHLAQPTLSTQLKQFEKAIKKILFERNKNKLFLTEYGKVVFEYAQSIFGLTKELEGMIAGESVQIPKVLNIGIQVGTPKAFCHAVLSHVLKNHPMARVHLKEAPLNQLLSELENLNQDVIMTDSPVTKTEGAHFETVEIGHVPLVFVASPKIAEKFRTKPSRKKEVPIILPADPSPVYHKIKEWLSSNEIQSRIVAEVQDVEIARRLALSGFGIAPLNAYTVSVSLPKNALVTLKWKVEKPVYENIYLISRERHFPNPIATYLLETFRIRV